MEKNINELLKEKEYLEQKIKELGYDANIQTFCVGKLHAFIKKIQQLDEEITSAEKIRKTKVERIIKEEQDFDKNSTKKVSSSSAKAKNKKKVAILELSNQKKELDIIIFDLKNKKAKEIINFEEENSHWLQGKSYLQLVKDIPQMKQKYEGINIIEEILKLNDRLMIIDDELNNSTKKNEIFGSKRR